jgi:hypothetical protein
LQPWRKERWCIPARDRARCVAQWEDVLDRYVAAHPDEEPLLARDEAAVQRLADGAGPLPLAPGRPAREDYPYQRHGTTALFLFFDPLRGWRRLRGREQRPRVDWAQEGRRRREEDYRHATKGKRLCENLNPHTNASLDEAFPAELTHRLARRREIHYPPRNGSWLNVAEIELSVLRRPCLERRLGDRAVLQAEAHAWAQGRNAQGCRVRWRFTTADARVKLCHLYPQL